ncbi:uncharacterized protein LOC114251356 [Bombyx mandarina]|uniref:Uncharacterized protein LOC114251356 n=1 Tax=Bombyx mandarina TaxID=7092 RepID=A0A6J2KGB7_BOMMA|nr:uncharacterized protein LOC114251356 [Bombyx mandarina]
MNVKHRNWQLYINIFLSLEHVHSQYIYGDCKRVNQIFYTHVHLDHIEVLGKIIMRGWIEVLRIPTCIILRAVANQEDTFRSTSYPFQICVPRITYCHSQNRFKYFYYEWYIPTEYIGGMDWDIYFYGPPNLEWQ